MSIMVDISGLDDLERDWATMCDEIEAGLEPVVKETLRVGREVATAEAPSRSGWLRSTIEGVITSAASARVAGMLYVGASYARYVVEGTKAHEIIARGVSLAFTGSSGSTVFRKRVHHPGTKPNPFFWRAQLPMEISLETLGGELVDRAVARFAR
jgi:hypothetical protein